MRTRAASAAVATVFVLNGVAIPSVAARLPRLKADLGLSATTLGVALGAAALGAVAGTWLASRASGRFGTRATVLTATLGLAVGLPLLGLASSAALLVGAFVTVGISDGAMDTAMNAQAVELERRRARAVMHRTHGAWSAGAVAGALAATVCAGLDVTPLQQFLGVAALMCVVAVVAAPRLLATAPPVGARPGGRRLAPPRPGLGAVLGHQSVVAVGVGTVLAAVVEGLPNDWGAVYTREVTGASAAFAGAAYTTFAVAMAATRFLGDALVERHGDAAVLRGAAGITGLGLVLLLLFPHPAVAPVALAMVGIGVAPNYPTLFRLAGRLDPDRPERGTALVSGVGRLGFLVAPPVVGAVADATTLRTALWIGPVTCVAVVGLAGRLVRGGGQARDDVTARPAPRRSAPGSPGSGGTAAG